MVRRLGFSLLCLIGIALLPSCAGMAGSDHRETNAEVILLSFGGTNGELVPCG